VASLGARWPFQTDPVRGVALCLALLLAGCMPSATVSPSPAASVAPSPTPASTATVSLGPPKVDTPRLLLSLPYKPPAVERPGATTSRVGGISARGPASLAVDQNDRVYIWDQARLRVVVFEANTYVRAIPLPYVERGANALLVESDRMYLRADVLQGGSIEYEIDANSGILLRAATDGSLYPRRRTGVVQAPPPYAFGADASGLEYIFTVTNPGQIQRYERHGAGGALLAYAVEPLSLKGTDAYVRADGALFELASDFGDRSSVYVYSLLAPSGAGRSATPPPPVPAPSAFGRSVPDRLTASLPDAGSVEFDASMRAAFWWLASLAKERADLVDNAIRPIFAARWNDGSTLDIGAAQTNLSASGKTYSGPARSYEQLAAYALAAPTRLADLTAPGATLRIADLPGTQRSLTSEEISQLHDSLSRGFAVSEGELPGVLELPFPVYEFVLGDAVIRLRGDDYGSVGRDTRSTGAFAHDGQLDDLARRWLPVPALSLSDVHSLFLADNVMFDQGGQRQDISRWKASIVRALTGAPGDSQSEPAGEPPAALTFRFSSGRTETVVVSRGSFTYRGRAIALPGVMSLVYYRGVP